MHPLILCLSTVTLFNIVLPCFTFMRPMWWTGRLKHVLCPFSCLPMVLSPVFPWNDLGRVVPVCHTSMLACLAFYFRGRERGRDWKLCCCWSRGVGTGSSVVAGLMERSRDWKLCCCWSDGNKAGLFCWGRAWLLSVCGFE